MRKIKIRRRSVSLNEKDYQQLLRRHDLNAVTKDEHFGYDTYTLPRYCICLRYSCSRCPLSENYRPRDCKHLLRLVAGRGFTRIAHLHPTEIWWKGKHDKKVRAGIEKIYKTLLRMKKY